ncbi:MAG TPA: 4-(cytidine 5'-diphospho)-2-C-methyl-D-erythritol kinase [Blastocatellia bacterium]|nr:4-(cytidine 5'-diphospho)-2-C-methyl-D-erythritol kinase [Blastocatellia bacterium]
MRVRSYAKINWILEVFGSRPDGYHELRTILQTIDLFDTLTFSSLPTGEIEIECDNPDVPLDGTNLISRAIQLVAGRTGCKKGVKVSIDKQIPIGAGLGGGSSNAAATIMALEKLWDIPLEPQDLFEIGTSIGADVPFFFFGGTAAGVGRGNEIYPLEDVDSRHLLLVNPRISVPTREAYRKLDSALTSQNPIAIMSFALLTPYAPYLLPTVTRNDLEQSVLKFWPQIAEVKHWLQRTSARSVTMSGSGATVFAVYETAEARRRAEASLAETGWLVIPTRTVGRAEYKSSLIETI